VEFNGKVEFPLVCGQDPASYRPHPRHWRRWRKLSASHRLLLEAV